MATLRVAIDARAAKTGRDEYLRYTGDLSKATNAVEKELDGFTKTLVRGFESAGVASKKISPNVLAVVQAIGELKGVAGGAKITVEQLGKAFEAYKVIENYNKALGTAQQIVTGFDRVATGTITTIDRLGNSFEAMDLRARAAKGAFENLVDAQRDAERELQARTKASFGEKIEREARVATAAYSEFLNLVKETPQTIFPVKFGAGIEKIDQATASSKGLFAEFGAGVKKVDRVIDRIRALNDAIADSNGAAPKAAFGAGINSPGPAYNPRGATNNSQPFGAGVDLSKPKAPDVFKTAFGDDLLNRQKQFVANTKLAQAEIDRLGGISSTARSQISQLFLGFSAIFAIREGISTVIDKIRGFTLALSEAKAVTNSTDEQFIQLAQTAREVGVNSVFGATKAAEALRSLAKAGFSAQESLQTLPQVLDFATVAGTNLDTSAELVSKTLRQFQLDTSNAERAVDALAITSNKTTTSVLPLAEALVNVGPIASDLNNSLEDTTALLGTLAERGIQGGSAGTKLKGVILSLISPSQQAKEAIQSLRDSNTGARLTLEQLNPAVRSVKEIFDTLSQSTLSAAEAELIFQQRFAGAGLVLAAGVETTQKIVQANEDLRGETKRVAAEINNNLNGSILRFSAAIEEASLAAGDAGLTGSLRGIVDFGRGVVLSLAGTSNNLDEISSAAKITAGAITSLTFAAGAFASIKLIGFLAQSQLGFVAFTKSVEAARIAAISFQGTAAIGPVLAAIGPAAFLGVAGLAAITLAVRAFNEETPEATEKTKAFYESLKSITGIQDGIAKAVKLGNLSQEAVGLDALIKKLEEFQERVRLGQKIEPLEKFKIRDLLFSAGNKDAYNVKLEITGEEGVKTLNAGLDGLKSRLLTVRTALAGSYRETGDALLDAKTNLEKFLDSLALQNQIAQETRGLDKESARDRAEIIRATYKISEKAIGEEKDRIDDLLKAYLPLITAAQAVRKEQEALAEQIATQAEAAKLFKREFGELTDKVKLLKFSNEQRRIEAEVIRFSNIAKEEGRALTAEETAAIRKNTAALIADETAVKAAKKEKSELSGIIKRAATAAAQEAAAYAKTISTTEDLVNRYKALADTVNESEEAQEKAAVLARFDAKTKKAQGEAVNILRKALVGYLDTIAKGDNRAAVRSVQELVEKYELQAAALGKTEDQQRSATAAQELANVTRGKEVAGIEDYTKRLNEAVETLNKSESKGRQKQAEDVVKNLEKELSYLKLTNDEKERQIALDELARASIGGKIEDEGNLRRKVEETVAALQAARKAREIGDAIAGGFAEAFEAALTHVDNFGEAALAIAREVSLEITRILLIRPLANSLATFVSGFAGTAAGVTASAKGNAFSGGNLVPFAKGGILDRPMMFPMNGGKTGLAGEAGPEAVLKLKRNGRGELGVIASDSGSQNASRGSVVHNHVYHITTPDAQSFRKSRRQIQQDASRSIGGGR